MNTYATKIFPSNSPIANCKNFMPVGPNPLPGTLSTVAALVSVATIEPNIAHQGRSRSPKKKASMDFDFFPPNRVPTTTATAMATARTHMSTIPIEFGIPRFSTIKRPLESR